MCIMSSRGMPQRSPLGCIRGGDMRSGRLSIITAFVAAALFAPSDGWADKDKGTSTDWPSAGADLSNSRYQSNESSIKSSNVGSLTLKWAFTTAGDVTAHPAVEGKYLYFPDSAGWLYKVD